MSDTGGAASTGNYGSEGMTAAGGLSAAYANYQAGRTNKRINDFNARYAQMQADQSLQAGELNVAMREGRERLEEGQTRAAYAGGGVVVGAGTSSAAIASESNAAAMDKQLIEINARRQALGFGVTAENDALRGRMAMQTGVNRGISTLLDTGAQEYLESDPEYGGYRGRGVSF